MQYDISYLKSSELTGSEIITWSKFKNSNDASKRFYDFKFLEDSVILDFLYKLIDFNQIWNKDYSKNKERSHLSKNFSKYFDYEGFISSLIDLDNLNSVTINLIYYLKKIEEDNTSGVEYNYLKNYFYKYNAGFSLSMKNAFLTRLMNFCIFQTKGNRNKFSEDYIKYYLIQVNENILLMDIEVFGIRQIRNYIRICCRLKKFKVIAFSINTMISLILLSGMIVLNMRKLQFISVKIILKKL